MRKIYLIALVLVSLSLPSVLGGQTSTGDTPRQRPFEFKFQVNGNFRSLFISQDSFFSADSLLYLTGVRRFFNLSNTGRFLLNSEDENTWELYDFAHNIRLEKIHFDSLRKVNGNVIRIYRKGKQGLLRHMFRYSDQYFYKKPVYDSVWQCEKCFWDVNTVYFQYIQGKKQGVFDGDGNRVLQKRTEDLRVTCHVASEPIMWVEKKNLYVPFNLGGEQLEGEYDDLLDENRILNMITVKKDERFGLYSIDEQKEVVPVIYDTIYDKGHYFICQKNDETFDIYHQQSYYDRQSKSYISYDPLVKLKPDYNMVDFIARIEYRQGILGTFSNEKMGLYNGIKDGFIIYPEYDSIKFLIPERYAVKDERGWRILKTSKTEEPREVSSSVYQCFYGGIKEFQDYSYTPNGYGDENALVRVKANNGKYGWINLNGKVIIPLIYDHAEDFELYRPEMKTTGSLQMNRERLYKAKVELRGRQYEINYSGEEI